MAIPKFLDDLNIIARLGNKPGTDDGLSDAGFKAKFDEGILKIQTYINNVLIPGIENSIDEDGLLSKISTALSGKLSLEGGGMRGPLNMNFEILSGIETPKNADHAANKEYVDDGFEKSKKYTDDKVKSFGCVLTAGGWIGDTAPFKQTVNIKGILGTDRPHYGPVYSESTETALAEREAFAMVDDLDTADGSVTFTCFEDKPEVNLTIQMEVHR